MSPAWRSYLADRGSDLGLLWPAIAQTAAAATVAWLLAHDVLGHAVPFFAPVASIVALALSYGDRVARAAEVVAGVSIGILVGWPLQRLGLGTPVALAAAVAAAMTVAVVLTGRRLVLLQAATSAVLMVTVTVSPGALASTRVTDAVAGGLCGLVVGVVAFPVNPDHLVRRSRPALARALGATLSRVAKALETADADDAASATRDAQRLDQLAADVAADVDTGRQIGRGSPFRRSLTPAQVRRPDGLVLVAFGTRTLARGAQRVLDTRAVVPEEAVTAVESLAEAARRLGNPPDQVPGVRAEALRAAQLANTAFPACHDLYTVSFLAQVRTLAAEILQADGATEDAAASVVRTA